MSFPFDRSPARRKSQMPPLFLLVSCHSAAQPPSKRPCRFAATIPAQRSIPPPGRVPLKRVAATARIAPSSQRRKGLGSLFVPPPFYPTTQGLLDRAGMHRDLPALLDARC